MMVMQFTMETNHTIDEAGKSSKAPGPGLSFGSGMESCMEISLRNLLNPFVIPTRMLRSAGLGNDAVYSGTSEEHTASIFTVGIEGNGLLRSFGSYLLDYVVP